MIFANQDADLLTWLANQIQQKMDVVAQGFWVGLFLSAIYLVVMLVTRWGDRHTLLKALGFSCLIHLISIAGLLAVVSTPKPGIGPEVLSVTPSEKISEAFIRFEVTFSEDIAKATFTLDDLLFEGPEGEISIRAVNALDDRRFEIVFPAQSEPGEYSLYIGPEIENSLRISMDQNRNGKQGEIPGDVYHHALTLEVKSVFEYFSEEPQELPIEGNTPVWNQLPEPLKPLMARIDQTNLEPLPLKDPQRELAPMPEEKETPIPDLEPNLPEQNPDIPTPDEPEEKIEPKSPAEIPVIDPEAIPLPDRPAPPKPRERKPVPNRGPFETPINRQPVRGATDRIDREIDPNRELASLETPDSPIPYLKRGPETDVIKNRTSPAPAIAPLPELGAPAAKGPEEAVAGQRTIRRPIPPADRDPNDRIDANINRRRTQRRPTLQERPRDPGVTGPTPDLLASRSVPVPVRPRLENPRIGRRTALPSTYRYRGPEQRRKAALKFGGSEASEKAVEEALAWLASNQSPEGFWDADGHGAGQVELTKDGLDTRGAEVRGGIPGVKADTGVTALAILAFLGAGYTHEEGPYAEHVDNALNWLIRQQKEDGFLGGEATYYARAYCHGMATYALAEAYGMRSDPTLPSPLREPLERAINYILLGQHPSDGGWRYRKGETGDMSIFGWNMMALKSAEIAGLKIPDANRNLLIKFLTDRSLGRNKGLASYHPKYGTQGPTPTMTAEALFSKQMLGLRRTNPASKEAIDYLMTHLPGRENLNFYYWYYGTLAVYQYGGDPWKKWNESLRDMLVEEQLSLGNDRGSWDPKDRWGGYGGRVYSTALSTLILEVYYRFLPLYKLGGE